MIEQDIAGFKAALWGDTAKHGVYVNIGWDVPGKALADKHLLPLRRSFLTPMAMAAVVREDGSEPQLVALLG